MIVNQDASGLNSNLDVNGSVTAEDESSLGRLNPETSIAEEAVPEAVISARQSLSPRNVTSGAATSTTSHTSSESEESIEEDATPDSLQSALDFSGKNIKVALHDPEDKEEVQKLLKTADATIEEGSDFDFIIWPPICEPNHFKQYKPKCYTRQWVVCQKSCTICMLKLLCRYLSHALCLSRLTVMSSVLVKSIFVFITNH
jgi:hypothetical protein